MIHVLHSQQFGGAEIHALDLMRGQREAGWQVLYAGPPGWLSTACEAAGIEWLKLPMRGLADLRSHWLLRQRARRWHADILHGHLIRGAFYAGWCARLLAHPLAICTAHATTARKHMGHCAHIIAVSQAVQRGLLEGGHSQERISVIYNGVRAAPGPIDRSQRAALRAELGIAAQTFAVVCSARFVADKALDVLVRAIDSAPANLQLYLIGDANTPTGDLVRGLLQSSPRLSESVHLLGYRADVQRLLPAFDAFALTSRREALSLSIIEAFAAGVPVVATDVGGIPELVRHEETGLLVPAGDVAAVTRALQRLHDDPELAQHLAQAAHASFERSFTAARMVAQTLAVYEHCLASTGPATAIAS